MSRDFPLRSALKCLGKCKMCTGLGGHATSVCPACKGTGYFYAFTPNLLRIGKI